MLAPSTPLSTRMITGVVAVAVALVLLTVASCGGGDEDTDIEETSTPVPTATQQPTDVPTAEPTPEPTPAPTATVPPAGYDLSDAPYYLDVSSVLPGFTKVDAASQGLSNADLGLGPDFSEVEVYMLDNPVQITFMYMAIASGDFEKNDILADFDNEPLLEEFLQTGFVTAPGTEDMELTINWLEVDVGDRGKTAACTITCPGLPDTEFDFLIFYQESGDDAALVFVLSIWEPGTAPTVDVETIGHEISDRLAS